jgi:peptidoglycan-associated lipoprotein
MIGTHTIRIVVVISLAACGGKAKTPPPKPSASATPVPAQTATAAKLASPHVGVSDDLAKQCSLRFGKVDSAPKFGVDDADLLPADRDILQQIADCLLKGPLAGRRVQLVGHADPRGTEEYNLGLGTRRAESVRTYLERLGVPAARLAPTTRGELDASGSDEASWQRDRRVDVRLVN